jgi:hypothetical protein
MPQYNRPTFGNAAPVNIANQVAAQQAREQAAANAAAAAQARNFDPTNYAMNLSQLREWSQGNGFDK